VKSITNSEGDFTNEEIPQEEKTPPQPPNTKEKAKKSNLNLELLTISNYENADIKKYSENRKILLEQRNRSSLQVVLA
jgi:hypothetical protein